MMTHPSFAWVMPWPGSHKQHLVLQVALAALITDGAIQRVVDLRSSTRYNRLKSAACLP